MRCSNCGKELSPQDKFCSQCGTAVPPQEVFCSQCGKKLAAEDKFCSQCGTAVSSPAKPVSQSAAKADRGEDLTEARRDSLLYLLGGAQSIIASNEKMIADTTNDTLKASSLKSAVVYAASELEYLTALKKLDQGINHTPEPITLAEKYAYLQEALAVVDKELNSGKLSGDAKRFAILVERKDDLRATIQKIDNGKASFRVSVCPHCHKWTNTDFTHCVHCYKSVNPSAPRPVPQAGGTTAPVLVSQAAPKPVSAPKPAPAPVSYAAPQPVSAPAPKASAAQVRYADESVKNWDLLPGEKSVKGRHAVGLLKPEGGKFTYHMQVTDRRILMWKESNRSTNFGYVARMGGGLLGQLIAAGAKAAVGAGPKPWVEIPLEAVSSCGVRNGSEFYIEADQTYVLQNLGKYDKFLPDLVENAKR